MKTYIKVMENGKAVNCFAMGQFGKCSALTETNCHNCNFFKTEAQVAAERHAAKVRLAKLGLNVSKYYKELA